MNSQKWKDMLADVPSVARKMSFVAFQMDMARDPEDALLDWKAGAERLEAYHHSHFALLVEAVAKKTGADPAQIADKDKRTEEQQQALLLEAGRLQVARLNHFFASNYMHNEFAILILSALSKMSFGSQKYISKYCILVTSSRPFTLSKYGFVIS